jgi:transposase InsO family protein
MCAVFEVSASGYYAWRSRSESVRDREDRRLGVAIRAIHASSRQTYGSPRVHRELRDRGESCGRHRTARLMRQEGLRGKSPRRFRRTTDSRHALPVAENVLDQQFRVERPDTVWAGDITYLRLVTGWLYLAVLLDVCSRRVVGWAVADHLGHELPLAALERALSSRRPAPGLVHHSDRGSQYASAAYRQRVEAVGAKLSMSRKGNCYDNAVVESFFATLKTEALSARPFASVEEASSVLFEYIEVFYNQQRRHSTLDYLSPAAYERKLEVAA